jgi:glycosyltransferase involved in cell wall biosynthesis
MVSALTEAKRVLEAVRSVAQFGDDVFLAVAGEGPLEDEFDALAHRLLPGRAMRLSVNPEQMPDLYRSCDVFLHMSLDEAFGNVFLEALSSGLPVIAHDCENTRWIFGKEDDAIGGAFRRQTEAAHENGLAYLVDTQKAEEVVHALRQAASEAEGLSDRRESRHAFVASRFSWDRSAEAYAEFLKEVARA